jgi:Fe-Mn family superoxide dismutase
MSNFTLPKLPYADDALAPVISANTISFHYGKHHKAYVDKLNELVPGTAYEGLSLEEVVKKSAKDEKGKAIFNNAGQIWNHTFYWNSMAPKGGEPTGKIKAALDDSFGGLDAFKAAFKAAAVGQFGSGWAWLVKGADGKLKIETCGSTPTTSTSRTAGRITSRPGSTSSRTGRSPRQTSAKEQSMLGTILLIVLI